MLSPAAALTVSPARETRFTSTISWVNSARRAEALLLLRLLQQREQLPHPSRSGVIDVAEIPLGLPEAGVQRAALAGQLLQILRRDVQDHPLIEVAPLHHGPVDAAPAHQHIVSRLQGVPLALDGVSGPPRQQHDDLVKAVIVIGDLLVPVVRQMEQPERLVQIAPLFIR